MILTCLSDDGLLAVTNRSLHHRHPRPFSGIGARYILSLGVTNLLVLALCQSDRCDLDRLDSFQRTPRLTLSFNPKEIGVSSIFSGLTHKFI
ncbi:MAG: hypothetical protein ACTSQ8_16280 [Candidatus Helarchaeota archaeon]